MSTSYTSQNAPSGIDRILVAVDLSPASLRAAEFVRNIARATAHIRLVSVADNPRALSPMPPKASAELYAARAELLRDAADALVQAKHVFAGCDFRLEEDVVDLSKHGGDIATALIDAADDWHADLLVVGARQHHGLLRWVEGTVSKPLATHSRCSLLIVPPSHEEKLARPPQRVLIAIDGSAPSFEALRYGMRFAKPEVNMRAVYVVDRAVRLTDFVPIHVLEDAFVEEGKAALATAAEVFAGSSCHCDTALISTKQTGDDIAHAIVREASHWNADLLVMGTHGRRGVARWLLGSVAGRVAHITQTPLLLVHAQDS
ncbi:universal stress family protein [Paraburkholderia fungorum]|uniref:Universal stress protein UspA n=2 Tax=Paraburkholderia TaxID=1822464 RepID=A0A160FWW7_9BURK|nr:MULTISPECIES: universal stress protein [Paraburkholderia]AJZ56819.1 universal stress family protein [Paraburkholderia fungorum]ANB77762.1 universal stress protein UspA [Paraburkholderia phytofirmans OLGA172]MDT8843822.1 universal stress protein [Paraburkholderia fungorum]